MPSLEERAAAAFGPDAPAESVGEASDANAAPSSEVPGESTTASAGASDAATERRARLERLRAEEAARVDAQRKHRDGEELRRRIDEAEQRAKAAEERASRAIDPASLTQEKFFELASTLNVPPQKLGEWLRERMTNPELAAEQAAVRALDPKLTAIEKRLADKEAQLDAFLQDQQRRAAQAEEQEAFNTFVQFTGQSGATAPHSARFLETFGPKEFHRLALSAAASVPPNAGAQAVLDQIEENLSLLARVYSGNAPAPQQRPAHPHPSLAAAKAPTTVSNTLAQQRAAVVDDDAKWASLSFEERSARVFR